MSMEVANRLAVMYTEMQADPDNLQKRADYFEQLADARLTDFYRVHDENQQLRKTLDEIIVIAYEVQEFGKLPNRKLLAIVQIGFKAASVLGYKVANIIDDFKRIVFTFEKT